MTLKKFKRGMGCVSVDCIRVEGEMPNGMRFSFEFKEEKIGKSVGFYFRFEDDTCNDFDVKSFDIFRNNDYSWMVIYLENKDIPLE